MNAIVTITNSRYLLGNIVLHYSLKMNKSNYNLIVLFDNLSDIEINILKSFNIKLIKCKSIKNPYKNRKNTNFDNVFMKLYCWNMIQYNKIIFVDNDILNLKNFDHLFKMNIDENKIMACRAKRTETHNLTRINTGFFMIKPSIKIYNELLKSLRNQIFSFDNADQGFINTFFGENKFLYFEDKYNFPKRRIEDFFDNKKRDITNLHFVGQPKPWSNKGEKGYEKLNILWINKFNECVDKYWKKKLGNELIELNKIVYCSNKRVEGNLMYHHNLLQPSKLIWYESELKRHKIFEISKLCKNILEIGVNAGHSALIMLKANPNINYYGFDINYHNYTQKAVNYLKNKFKNVNYIIGDSEKTIPKFNSSRIQFDLIHIDGGHTVDKARKDIMNCKKHSNKNTIVVFDDCNLSGSMGPKLLKLWNNLIYLNIK